MDKGSLDLLEFAKRVAERCDQLELDIIPEQVIEVMGGIGNLYTAELMELKLDETVVWTRNTFAWGTIGLRKLKQQIMNCAGVKYHRASELYRVMEKTLNEEVYRRELANRQVGLALKPLGVFLKATEEYGVYRLEVCRLDPQIRRKYLLPYGDGRAPLATIIHTSDLHIAGKLKNDETELKAALAQLPFVKGIYAHSYHAAGALANTLQEIFANRSKCNVPLVLIVSGDLTRLGGRAQFETGYSFLTTGVLVGAKMNIGLHLNQSKNPDECDESPVLFIVPGNHDVIGRYTKGLRDTFDDYFPWTFPSHLVIVTNGRRVVIHGLDSTHSSAIRNALAQGEVPQMQLDELGIKTNPHSCRACSWAIRIACLHHPPIKLDKSVWDPTMELNDYERVANELKQKGINLALSGHIHTATYRERSTDSPNILVAGSTLQQFGERQFWLLDIYDLSIKGLNFVLDEGAGEFCSRGEEVEIRLVGREVVVDEVVNKEHRLNSLKMLNIPYAFRNCNFPLRIPKKCITCRKGY